MNQKIYSKDKGQIDFSQASVKTRKIPESMEETK